jgi:hypothetical protein
VILDDLEHFRRNKGPLDTCQIVGQIAQRKETRECQQKQDRGEEREKQIVRQLRAETQQVIVNGLFDRPSNECRPREPSGINRNHARRKCKRDARR